MMRRVVVRASARTAKSHNWFAVHDPFDAARDPIGFGATADAALADLNTQIQERDNARN